MIAFPKKAFRHMPSAPAPRGHGAAALGVFTLLIATLSITTLLITTTAGRAQPLRSETVACKISGYSIATDRAGAAVRAEPDASAKILGRLAPAQKATKADYEDVPPGDQLWRTEFQVVGFREGWFLIEKALHPYDDPDRRSVLGRRSTGGVKTYAARGWISQKDVGGKYTYHHRSLPNGALFSEPQADATRVAAKNGRGEPIQGGNSPKRVLSCNGDWVQVESHDGVVGWWRGLCGKPIADCDRD
jgi:hypothetical protein